MQSSGPIPASNATKRAGSASASAVGTERSRNTRPCSSPHRSTVSVPGSIPITRVMRLLGLRAQLPRDVGDRLGVQHEVVTVEQARDARLVQFHLQVADGERSEAPYAILRDPVIHQVDAFDPERRDGWPTPASERA